MSQFQMPDFQDDLDPQSVVTLVVTVLRIYYQREADRINEILRNFDDLFDNKLVDLWENLQRYYPSPQSAFMAFVQIVEANLDGGSCPNHLLMSTKTNHWN